VWHSFPSWTEWVRLQTTLSAAFINNNLPSGCLCLESWVIQWPKLGGLSPKLNVICRSIGLYFLDESTSVIHSKIMDLVHFYDEFSQVESPVLLIISYSLQGTIREWVINELIFGLSRHLFLDTFNCLRFFIGLFYLAFVEECHTNSLRYYGHLCTSIADRYLCNLTHEFFRIRSSAW